MATDCCYSSSKQQRSRPLNARRRRLLIQKPSRHVKLPFGTKCGCLSLTFAYLAVTDLLRPRQPTKACSPQPAASRTPSSPCCNRATKEGRALPDLRIADLLTSPLAARFATAPAACSITPLQRCLSRPTMAPQRLPPRSCRNKCCCQWTRRPAEPQPHAPPCPASCCAAA